MTTSIGKTQNDGAPRSMYRGVLALFKNIDRFERHPFHMEQMTEARMILRTRKGQRRQKKLEEAEQPSPSRNDVALEDYIARTEITLLFFFHPTQPHSLRLRQALSSFCDEHSDKLFCMAIFGGDPDAATAAETHDIKLFLRGTGFLAMKDDSTTSALKFLDVTQIPSLVVIPNETGRPIMGQEVALEWNAVDASSAEALLQRWKTGSSGLSLPQMVFAKTLGDSSSVCTLM